MNATSLDAAAKASGVGRFIWYELSTPDVDGALAFYGAALGWGVQPFGGPEPYHVLTAAGRGIGGVARGQDERPQWIAYIYVDDVDGTLARGRQLGGRVLTPGTEIPDVGRFGILADPQGASVALLKPTGEDQPDQPMKLGHVGWNELHTTDSAAAWSFYSMLFGWKPATTMDMGEYGTYSIFRHAAAAGDAWLGGMSDMAKHMHVPPHWLYYVNVDSMEGALARSAAGGGKVLNGPMDVPGGRAAQCQDPQGGTFAIFAQEPAA